MRPRLNRVFLFPIIAVFVYLLYTYAAGTSNFFTRHVQQQRQRAQAKIQLIQLNYLIPPFAPLVAFSEGKTTLSASDWKKYVEYFEKVREIMPQRWDAYMFLGYCYFYQGHTAQAAEAFEKSIALNPRSFWPYYDLGIIAAQQGNGQAAAALLSHALTLTPTDTARGMFESKLYLDVRNSAQTFDVLMAGDLKGAYENAFRLGALAAQPNFKEQVQALAGRLPILIF